jgi:CRP/FNR family cyclic AMP-dependent transcriptional regulator
LADSCLNEGKPGTSGSSRLPAAEEPSLNGLLSSSHLQSYTGKAFWRLAYFWRVAGGNNQLADASLVPRTNGGSGSRSWLDTHPIMMSGASNSPPVAEPSRINLNRPLLPALQGLTQLGSASLYEDEIFGILDRIVLFEDLGRTEVSQLCRHMECFSARRGDVIMKEDDDGDFLGIILTGEVSVVKHGDKAQGKDKLLAVVGPGTSLGEMSLINGKPRFATCIAREPTDIAVLTRDTIYDILVLHPSLGNKVLLILLQITSERLRETSNRLLPFIGAGA